MKKLLIPLLAALLLIAVAAAEAPAFSGRPALELDAEPVFLIDLDGTDLVYLPLDDLGRVQGVSAVVRLGEEQIPTRAVVAGVIPSGWQQTAYSFIPGVNLYNRCHLLGHQLGGAEIAENLLTGTQYLNLNGMKPYEDAIADYVRRTGNPVRMEVLPYFEGENLVCTGVFINAQSVGDDGISICAFCFNVQPGVAIDYRTGASTLSETTVLLDESAEPTPAPQRTHKPQQYVLNTNTMRFHVPFCPSVDDMKEKNMQDFYGTREELIDMGYSPCGRCQP